MINIEFSKEEANLILDIITTALHESGDYYSGHDFSEKEKTYLQSLVEKIGFEITSTDGPAFESLDEEVSPWAWKRITELTAARDELFSHAESLRKRVANHQSTIKELNRRLKGSQDDSLPKRFANYQRVIKEYAQVDIYPEFPK